MIKNTTLIRGTIPFLFMLLVVLAACTPTDSAHEHTDTYTCPMHPTVVSDKPGTCPVCGMDLVRKARPGEEVKITDELARLLKSPNENVIASIQTIRGEYKTMPIELEVEGIVSYDTRQVYGIPTRIGGRLEKVYLKYNFQHVQKGQKVADIYSPELVNAQRELIYLQKNDAENKALIEASRQKLRLLGASEQQLSSLETEKEITYTFTIYSPYEGYVVSETQTAPVAPQLNTTSAGAGSGGMGMGANADASTSSVAAPSNSSETLMVREGSYVSPGQLLFKIVSTQSIWLEFNVPSTQAASLKVGQPMRLMTGGGEEVKINFIEPFAESGENFTRLRTYYRRGDLLVGQLVKAKISSTSTESLWLPSKAISDLGMKQIVFVKERGQFKPKEILTGSASASWTQVTKGLASGDEVAANSQFLIDSESFTKTSH